MSYPAHSNLPREQVVQSCNCCGVSDYSPLFTCYIFTLVRCNNCGLHFVDPMPDEARRLEEVKEGRYGDGQRVIDAAGQLRAEQALSPLFRAYLDRVRGIVPSGRLLDVGCGAGTLMRVAMESGFVVEGIELTADRLAKARETTGAVVYDKPVEALGLAESSYDVITLVNVFSHLADPRRTLLEIARLLRPGGVVMLATGEISGVPVRREHLPEWTLGDELFFLGDGTIDKFAEQLGLEVASADRRWLPDALYSRERFRVMGRSARRNAVKRAFLVVPGALPTLHWAMSRRQADNPIHSAVFVLRKPIEHA